MSSLEANINQLTISQPNYLTGSNEQPRCNYRLPITESVGVQCSTCAVH